MTAIEKPVGSKQPAIIIGIACVVILSGLATIAFSVGKIAWFLFLLGVLGLCGAVVGVYYLLNRYAPRLETALQDSQLERFKRLEGLFHSIPRELRDSPENRSAADEFRALAGQLESLIDESGSFASPLAPDLVHNLHLFYLQVASVEFLSLEMIPLRQEFRDAVGEAAYQAYLEAPAHEQQKCASDPVLLTRALRADATFLANETRRQLLLKSHVESTRQKLVKGACRSWSYSAVPLIAVLTVFVFCKDAVDQARYIRLAATTAGSMLSPDRAPESGASALAPPEALPASVADATPSTAEEPARATPGTNDSGHGKNSTETKKPRVDGIWMANFAHRYLLYRSTGENPPLTGTQIYTTFYHLVVAAAMLALVAIAGATGGMLSVIQRVQSVVGDTSVNADLRTLSQCGTAVFFAPITGVLFALVISIMFAGQFVAGQIFPKVDVGDIWYFHLFHPTEMPKWLLWAFAAGFSERLVPDMLNTFAKKALDQAVKGPTPTPAAAPDRALAQANAATAANSVIDETDRARGAEALAGVPALHAPPDAIPSDATEVTLSGESFCPRSEVIVNGRPVGREALLELTATSIRVRLEPSDIIGAASFEVVVRNPPPGGGESEKITIPIAEEIGG